MSLAETLAKLSTPGGVTAVIGIFFALFGAKINFYKSWHSNVKFWAMLIVCLIVPILALFLRILLGYVDGNLPELVWRALSAGFIAWASSQGGYSGLKQLRGVVNGTTTDTTRQF